MALKFPYFLKIRNPLIQKTVQAMSTHVQQERLWEMIAFADSRKSKEVKWSRTQMHV